MAIDDDIFGLRFGSNDELLPVPEEINAFLRTSKEGGHGTHDSDVAAYRETLAAVLAWEERRVPADTTAYHALRDLLFYGMLVHSRFYNRALKSAVEQYKFHLHSLHTLDFRKPETFIRSAEEELHGLDPRRREHAGRLAKLRAMIDERRAALAATSHEREALVRELIHLGRYIASNVALIAGWCRASQAVLTDEQKQRTRENRLIEDIRSLFKDRLKDELHQGKVTKRRLDEVKKEADTLCREFSLLVQEDGTALIRSLDALASRILGFISRTDALFAEFERCTDKGPDCQLRLLDDLEQALVAFIADHSFMQQPRPIRLETEHQGLLLEKRKEMIEHLLSQLKRDRRERAERRSGKDRRRLNVPGGNGPERRSGKDRRKGGDRRSVPDSPSGEQQ